MRLSGRGQEGEDLIVRRAGGHLVADRGVQREQRAFERVHHHLARVRAGVGVGVGVRVGVRVGVNAG